MINALTGGRTRYTKPRHDHHLGSHMRELSPLSSPDLEPVPSACERHSIRCGCACGTAAQTSAGFGRRSVPTRSHMRGTGHRRLARPAQPNAVLGQKLHPVRDRPRVALPRTPRRAPDGGSSRSHMFTTSSEAHPARPRTTDPHRQHRHPLGDQRPTLNRPEPQPGAEKSSTSRPLAVEAQHMPGQPPTLLSRQPIPGQSRHVN